MSTISALWGRLGRHSRHIKRIRRKVLKKIAKRIESMNDQEAKCLLANLQMNNIPPYRLYTHPTDFVIHEYGLDHSKSGGIYSDKPETIHAMRELGMHRVREIANAVCLHPTLGEDALTAMLDGKRVIMSVERLVKPTLPARRNASTTSVQQRLLN